LTHFYSAKNKEPEFKSFIAETNSLADEIVKQISENPSVQGVEEAQKVLDEKKGFLKIQIEKLKKVKGSEVDEVVKKELEKNMLEIGFKLNRILITHQKLLKEDQFFRDKIMILLGDFTSLLQ
jgi:hypothetical protein